MSPSATRLSPSTILLCSALLAGCGSDPAADADAEKATLEQAAKAAQGATVLDIQRDDVRGDVHHYSILLKVGGAPHALLRIHRIVSEDAPWQPHASPRAAMLLHGDFSTFTTTFALSQTSAAASPDHDLAVHLAERGIDVWGFDRRWTSAAAADSVADFADMGFVSALDDTERALLFARSARGAAGKARMTLAGFSRGGHLAYAYAAREAGRPSGQQHIDSLAPIDIYAAIAPEDDALRQGACGRRDDERAQIAMGTVDSDNSVFIQLGDLARSSPADPSPLISGLSNEGALLAFTAQTFVAYPATPDYHLAGGVITDGAATALRYSSEAVIEGWLSSAPPHQALAEVADSDALWCGDAPAPLAFSLGDIHVPIFYLGAAGGFGDHGLYTTKQVGKADVTALVIRRLDPASEAEDFGHADLIHGTDAPALAFQPLASWLLAR